MFENMRKPIPFPHPYAVCAPEGVPIKAYYKDDHDEVFIFLHPFMQPYSPGLILEETSLTKLEWMEKTRRIGWEEVLNLLEMKDYGELDVALRTLTSSLHKKYEDKITSGKVFDLREKEGIYEADAGFLPIELINPLLEAIKNEGHDWIWLGDEFGAERRLEYIQELWDSDKLNSDRFNLFAHGTGRYNLFTHNNEMLITTHWDSHFSMLCSDKETIERVRKHCDLEGFYCDDKTEIFWSLER